MARTKWEPSLDSIASHLRQPSQADFQRIQREIKAKLRWSGVRIANYIGVPHGTWRQWIQGGRIPGHAARRLIWWFWCSICAPEHLATPYAFLLWGGVQENEGQAEAKRYAAAIAKGKFPPSGRPRQKSKRPLTLAIVRRSIGTCPLMRNDSPGTLEH